MDFDRVLDELVRFVGKTTGTGVFSVNADGREKRLLTTFVGTFKQGMPFDPANDQEYVLWFEGGSVQLSRSEFVEAYWLRDHDEATGTLRLMCRDCIVDLKPMIPEVGTSNDPRSPI